MPSMKRVSAGICRSGRRDQDRDREQHHRADLQEGRQVIPGREQQPHRQYGGDESVADQQPRERGVAQRERRPPDRVDGDAAADPDREQQQDQSEQRDLEDAARAEHPQVDAHHDRDRNGHRDGESAPGTLRKRSHDDQRQHGEQDHHDHQDPDHRDHAGGCAHLAADHLAERPTVAPGREEEHEHVLDGAREHDADDDPERARQVAHLRREHRPDQRAGAGDRREVMPEQDAAFGGHEVETVVAPPGGCRPATVDAERVHRDVARVEAERDQIDRDRCGHQPKRADGLAAPQGDGAQARRPRARPVRSTRRASGRRSVLLFAYRPSSRLW